MDTGLAGKVAIVTGANRGIGRACAEQLAREGADIVLVARDAGLLADAKHTIEGLGRRAVMHACDLRQADAAGAVLATALSAFGRIDVLVNSAGATKRGDFFALTDADFDDGFALKFMGAVRLTRATWFELAKTGGAIVTIIGMGGRNAEAEFTIGGPVNAALINFTKAMADRGVHDGVRVMGLNPGLIETDRIRRRLLVHIGEHGGSEDDARQALLAKHGITRLGKPEEIGRIVCFLAGSTGAFMQGTIVDADGGEFHGV